MTVKLMIYTMIDMRFSLYNRLVKNVLHFRWNEDFIDDVDDAIGDWLIRSHHAGVVYFH